MFELCVKESAAESQFKLKLNYFRIPAAFERRIDQRQFVII